MSVRFSVSRRGRSTASSATDRGLYSDASCDASESKKVRFSRCGATSRTLSRCAAVIVSTRSALAAILELSWRAEKFEESPPKLSITSAASGWIGWSITALVPALETRNPGRPSEDPWEASKRSAVGDLHMFPVQTNSTFSAHSSHADVYDQFPRTPRKTVPARAHRTGAANAARRCPELPKVQEDGRHTACRTPSPRRARIANRAKGASSAKIHRPYAKVDA